MRKIHVFLLILISTFIFSCLNVDASSEKIINVLIQNGNEKGYFEYKDGEYSGYYYDYLMAVKKDSWQYNFTTDKTKPYDIVVGTISNAENNKTGDYQTKYPIVSKDYIVGFSNTNYDFTVNDITSCYNKLIGAGMNDYIYGTTTALNSSFKDFCKNQGINCGSGSDRNNSKITYSVVDDPIEYFLEDMVDGILVDDSKALEYELLSAVKFSSISLYIESKNKDLIDTIDNNVNFINSIDSDYISTLKNKYFSSIYQRTLKFNDEELEYMQGRSEINVGVLSCSAPFSYVENGQLKGVITNYIKRIEEKFENVNFKYKTYDSIENARKALLSGEIDINLVNVYYIGNSNGDVSSSYYKDKIGIYLDKHEKNGKIAAFSEHTFEYAKSIGYGDNSVILFKNIEEAIKEYKNGNVRGIIGATSICSYYINKEQLFNLELSLTKSETVYYSFEYGSTISSISKSIITKITSQIDEQLMKNEITSEIINAYTPSLVENFRLKDFINKYAIVLVTVFVIIICIIVFLASVILFNINRSRKKAYDEIYVDHLTKGNTLKKFLLDVNKIVKDEENWSVIYFDIINFKNINTMFGEKTGDYVIVKLYNKLVSMALDSIVARIYADRFVVAVKYSNEKNYIEKLDYYAKLFYRYLISEFPDFNVSLRCGVAYASSSEDISITIDHASQAAHILNKTTGVNYLVFDDTMALEIIKKSEIERDMEKALASKEFEAFYQPKVNALTNEIVGAEALIRWNHPTKGLLSPGVFIDIFESNGFIVDVDFYIFTLVCKHIRNELDEGRKVVTISSNFSRAHMMSYNFVTKLNEIADKFEVPHKYLEIELTETMSFDALSQYKDVIVSLRSAGYKIAIDDFGSGYSSIQLLYNLPITTLKLDATYARKTNKSDFEDSLMQSIIDICLKNDIDIICEGVETKEQLDYVLSRNCTNIQGYYFSRPLPEIEYIKYKEGKK